MESEIATEMKALRCQLLSTRGCYQEEASMQVATKQRATGELLHSKCIGEFVYDFKLARYDFKLARYDCYVYEKVWSLKHFWKKVKKEILTSFGVKTCYKCPLLYTPQNDVYVNQHFETKLQNERFQKLGSNSGSKLPPFIVFIYSLKQ